MKTAADKLKIQLAKCRTIISKGYTNTKNSGLNWLNSFCAEFLNFSNQLHSFIAKDVKCEFEANEHLENIFLCLTQIVVCIKYVERTIKAEQTSGVAISASRQHFLDRIHWCLERLRGSLSRLVASDDTHDHPPLDECTYVELMDLILDSLRPYSSYAEDGLSLSVATNLAAEHAEVMFTSKQMRIMVDLILGHTLAFANVALQDDKKALSALCQNVLHECISFQEECNLSQQINKSNDCKRKMLAISLENALYKLEDYINESLLRLVYTCFLDFNKFSIDKLREAINTRDPDDPYLDELIADFDVNLDRTTQIGIFAIAFAPTVKMKTIVRSCLASLESLDSCIIPSLQTTKNSIDIHSEILEQHFNEEVGIFKNTIQEIIDSQTFIECYHEMLCKCIAKSEKQFNKIELLDLIEMGEFLCEHFELSVNSKELHQPQSGRFELFRKFLLMLGECKAILMCADQVEVQRILKRFKILKSMVRKLADSFTSNKCLRGDKNSEHNKWENVFITSAELSDSQRMFESIGIAPSIRSILYCNDNVMRRRSVSDSLKGNYSKLPIQSPLSENENIGKSSSQCTSYMQKTGLSISNVNRTSQQNHQRQRPCSVRRKESLRTIMFKRQKSNESEKAYSIYQECSASLHISEILDQLTGLSSDFAVNTSMATKNITSN